MTGFQEFKQLHEQNSLLQIGNVWDVNSALLFEKLGYRAIGTSSAAIAESLGYEDGEEMSFHELLSVVKLIKERTSLPLTVDLEAGYSRNPDNILKNIISLNKLGVVGINLEDSVVEDGSRKIVDAEEFGTTIQFIKNAFSKGGINIFLNVRTDSFLMGLDDPLSATVTRSMIYERSGADGIFVPCVTAESHIKKIVDSTSIPVNVMAMPDLPAFSTLQRLGVKRVSMGPFFYKKMNDCFNQEIKSINETQSFSAMFSTQ